MEIKNDGRLKICWMRIVGYQQFQDVFLDFTHPETGEPLDKICLIGANGTGKTVVLEMIYNLLSKNTNLGYGFASLGGQLFGKIIEKGQPYIFFSMLPGKDIGIFNWDQSFELELKSARQFADSRKVFPMEVLDKWFAERAQRHHKNASLTERHSESRGLLTFVEAEANGSAKFSPTGLPETNLGEALAFGRENVRINRLKLSDYVSFWKKLIFECYIRFDAQATFEKSPKNIDKSKRELIREFSKSYPDPLEHVSKHWNRILEKANLYFDYENAKIPLIPDQNFQEYVRSKLTSEDIYYNRLSTGIRSFIFRIGYLIVQYYNQKIDRGFLLVDEPELGLFPDFLYDLVDVYRQVTTDRNGENNTQMFFATHEPIIAAQFEWYERVILEWNDDGSVSPRRGVSPIGDDPNDILTQDFEVRNLMGKEGLAKWEEVLQLRRKLIHSKDEKEKERLMTTILEIGKAYHFGPHEVPSKNK
jgi:predicted ATPase